MHLFVNRDDAVRALKPLRFRDCADGAFLFGGQLVEADQVVRRAVMISP